MTKICLNMIVKNESAILRRALESVAPFISSYVIVDTGSTDDTREIIAAVFDTAGIPGRIGDAQFENFEQARNEAWRQAMESSADFDYLLFMDADMELVVEDPDAFKDLKAGAYAMTQKAFAGLEYDNTRLVRRDANAHYVGVTHEYIALPSPPAKIVGAWFQDHACGSNRANKAERDIKLLVDALEADPDHPRYIFYLAQTYFETGRFAEARDLYAKRKRLGGFEEEAWFAGMCEGLAARNLGDETAFEHLMMEAFTRRPNRAEPLYHLADHYLGKGWNDAAAMVCEEGFRKRRPKHDVLFVDTSIYEFGFARLFAISGFYSEGRRPRAFYSTNWQALARHLPQPLRAQANSNLPHFLGPLGKVLRSWEARRIAYEPPAGWQALNPSVCVSGGQILVLVRSVNYRIDYRPEGTFYTTPDNAPITTRNFLVEMDAELVARAVVEVAQPADLPPPKFSQILGFEDLRLFERHGALFVSGTICELTEAGDRQIVLARIGEGARLTDWAVVEPEGLPRRPEKNWMPIVGEAHRWVYSCEPIRVVDAAGETTLLEEPEIVCDTFRGGSQLVPFNGGYLCVIHEVQFKARENRRIYFHRFVWFDAELRIKRVSLPYFFGALGIEFCAGLAWHPDGERLLVSYGVEDREAWIAAFSAAEISEPGFLLPIEDFKKTER